MRKVTLSVFGLVVIGVFMIVGAATAQTQTPFQRMDRNGDNRLSRQELQKPSVEFERMDRNADGFISREEAGDTPLTVGAGGGPAQGRETNQQPRRDAKPAAGASAESLFVDTHNHLVGRVSKGKTRQFDYEGPAKAALTSMDAAGVKLNLVMPMPPPGG